ncbi:hypothetical protein BDU57DRAFT_512411, partial [Ampelomyces quisqualis]
MVHHVRVRRTGIMRKQPKRESKLSMRGEDGYILPRTPLSPLRLLFPPRQFCPLLPQSYSSRTDRGKHSATPSKTLVRIGIPTTHGESAVDHRVVRTGDASYGAGHRAGFKLKEGLLPTPQQPQNILFKSVYNVACESCGSVGNFLENKIC